MDDVATCDSQQDLGVLRNDELSRSHNRCSNSVLFDIRTGSGIVVFPPPLLTSDVDRHFSVARLGQLENCSSSRNGNTQENQNRNNSQDNFQSRLTMGLLGDCLSTIAVSVHRPRHRSKNNDTNNAGDVKHWSLQIVDLFSIRSGWLPRILRCILGATRQETQRRNGNRCL